MLGWVQGLSSVMFRDADDRQLTLFAVDSLQLGIRVITCGVKLEPLVEENLAKAELLLNSLRDRPHQLSLFSGQGECHEKLVGDLPRRRRRVSRIGFSIVQGSRPLAGWSRLRPAAVT